MHAGNAKHHFMGSRSTRNSSELKSAVETHQQVAWHTFNDKVQPADHSRTGLADLNQRDLNH